MKRTLVYLSLVALLGLLPLPAAAKGVGCDVGKGGEFKDVVSDSKTGVAPEKLIVRGPCVAAFTTAIFQGCNGFCSGGGKATKEKSFNFADFQIIKPAEAAGPSPGSFLQKCLVKEAEVKSINTVTSNKSEVEGRCDNIKDPLHAALRMHMSVVTTSMPKPPSMGADAGVAKFMPAVFVKQDMGAFFVPVQLDVIASFFAMKGIEKGFMKLLTAFPKYGPSTFGASSIPSDGVFFKK